MFRIARHLAVAVLVAFAGLLLVPANAYALSVTTAELKDGQLRVDGQDAAPGIFVTVTSTPRTVVWNGTARWSSITTWKPASCSPSS